MAEDSGQQNISDTKEIFRRLAHFVTPPIIEGKKLPEIILENIIEQVIFISDSSLDTEEIKKGIKDKLKLDFELYEIEQSIENLIKKNYVIQLPNSNKYSLAVNRLSQLKTVVKEKEETHQRILKKFDQFLRGSYSNVSDEGIDSVIEDFQAFLAIFFLWSGADAVNLLYGTRQDKFQVLNLIKEKDVFALLPKRSKEIKDIERDVFIKFLLSLSSEEKEYFQDLLDKSLEYFTITLDKKCEALVSSSFKGWQMIIDTNFIYNLLGLNSDFPERAKKSAEQILMTGSHLGISFYVSPETIDEFKASTSRARDFLEQEISSSLSELSEEIVGGNAIISAYLREKEEKGITSQDFLSQLEHFVDVLKSYNIKERKDYYNTIKNSGELTEMSEKMESLTGKGRYVAAHDSFHYLLILKLRKREGAGDSFKSNKTWFLTYDHVLPDFDQQVRGDKIIPFAIHPHQLRRIIRPLVSRADDFEAVFIEFVSKPTSRAFSDIPVDMAGKILARISYYEKRFNITNAYEIASSILLDSHLANELNDLLGKATSQEISQIVDREIKKHIQVKVEDSKEYRGLLKENLILKWLIFSLFGIIQVGFNILYFQRIVRFFAQYIHSGTVLVFWIFINIVIFVAILAIPYGKDKILENLDFLGKISKKIKGIANFGDFLKK